MQSVQRHHPRSDRYIIVCDEKSDGGVSNTFADVIYLEQLQIPDSASMKLRYDVMELSTAIKPFSVLFLDRRYPGCNIIYLDPDILVTAPLTHVEIALEGGAEVVLTPHLTSPLDDGFQPDDLAIMKSGIYNLGFIAFRLNLESRKLVEWWRDRCRKDAIVDIADNKFTDQRWMDMAPAFVKNTHILHNHSYNLAYWNLSHRKLKRVGDSVVVDGEKLRFVHFSGIDPVSPERFSKHQNRFKLSSIGALEFLYKAYIEALFAHGWEKSRAIPYAFNYFGDGRRINKFMRLSFRRHDEILIADAVMRNGSFFDEPDRDCDGFNPPLITVLMHEVWRERADLRAEFNLKTGEDRRRFIEWFIEFAGDQEGIDELSIAAAGKLLRPAPSKKRIKPWASQITENGPSDRAGLEQWLAEPVPLNILLAIGAPPLPRHLAMLWEIRADLKDYFPCQNSQDLWAYFIWCITDGASQRAVDPALIAPSIETFLNAELKSEDVSAPPVSQLMNYLHPVYSRANPGLSSDFPDLQTSILANAIWLIGKATSNYNWPISFTKSQREWSLERCQDLIRTEVPISNLMFAIWRLRPDIQQAFDLQSKNSQISFLAWLVCFGMREFGIPLKTLPDSVFLFLGQPVWPGVRGAIRFHALCRERRLELHKFDIAKFQGRKALVDFINHEVSIDQWSGKEWLKYIDEAGLRSNQSSSIRNVLRMFHAKKKIKIDQSAAPTETPEAHTIVLTGLKSHISGRGEDVRVTGASLKWYGLDFEVLDRFNGTQQIMSPDKPILGVNIVHLNAETAAADYVFLRRAGVAGMRTVGYLAWELSRFPAEWRHAFSFYDEVWAATDFAYDSFVSASKKPVVKVPLGVEAPKINEGLSRSHFNLPESAYIFYFGFDFRSFVARKNPYAAIAAFKAAFPDPRSGVILLLKTLGGQDRPQELKKLKEYVGLEKRVIIQDVEYSAVEMASLINLCNCYVSLHRSEGFGRGPAEAMLLNKPVIATAYSGNMDYMDDKNSCLVEYKLIPVQPGEYPGFENQVWADPSVDHAAYWMGRIAGDSALATSLGDQARLTIERLYSPEVIGKLLMGHINRLNEA